MIGRSVRERYFELLRAYANRPEEKHLLAAADLGRELVRAEIPPEEIVELHEEALDRSAKGASNMALLSIARCTSVLLVELLMAYGLFFREQFDIHKRMEETLRKEKEFSEQIIQESPIFFVAISAEGKLRMMNKTMLRALGYTIDEVIGRDYITTFVPKKNHKMLLEVFEGHIKRGESSYIENHVLTKDGRELLVDWHGTPVFKGSGEVDFFIGVGVDISDRVHAQEELEQSFIRLQSLMEETVNVLASVAEMRDSYTAGHQQRVADLSCAIAVDMGLSREQVDGIRITALVHDIGKIYIPSEILNKPGHLTEIEFTLVKVHPQVGYDALKTIKFPWPVAQVVHQHHERVDGSGYPYGLSGKEIFLEAKILGVADVVEAMSSHRPYRAAYGIQNALEEIAYNRGVLYDSRVADVCLKLFSERRFSF